MSSKSLELPASISSFQPEILKIKIEPFRDWIERRLPELLEGLEDEILCSLVFNYLEDAQKRAKREGPAANPSGGLTAEQVFTALSGFLGTKKARDFIVELFTLLQEAQNSPDGIPAEFAVKAAESAAFDIIDRKKKEMELSERVRREIRHSERYNREDRRREDYRRERGREHEKDYEGRGSDTDRDYYRRQRDSHRHSSRNYDRHERGYESHRERRDSESRVHSREYDSHRHSREYESNRHSREYDSHRQSRDYESHRNRRDSVTRRISRSPPSHNRRRSPIPSSSPESPSPCWESSIDPSIDAKPRAPAAQELIPNELEQALRAKALKSQKKE